MTIYDLFYNCFCFGFCILLETNMSMNNVVNPKIKCIHMFGFSHPSIREITKNQGFDNLYYIYDFFLDCPWEVCII